MININNVYKNKLCNAPYITKIVNKQYFKSKKEKLKIVIKFLVNVSWIKQ